MEIVAFLTKSQEGANLTKQGRRKGNSMRGLPDSAILGTYGRMKHARHKKYRSAKDYKATADFLNSILIKLIKKQEAKLNKLTKV
jgi:hypothetical protein